MGKDKEGKLPPLLTPTRWKKRVDRVPSSALGHQEHGWRATDHVAPFPAYSVAQDKFLQRYFRGAVVKERLFQAGVIDEHGRFNDEPNQARQLDRLAAEKDKSRKLGRELSKMREKHAESTTPGGSLVNTALFWVDSGAGSSTSSSSGRDNGAAVSPRGTTNRSLSSSTRGGGRGRSSRQRSGRPRTGVIVPSSSSAGSSSGSGPLSPGSPSSQVALNRPTERDLRVFVTHDVIHAGDEADAAVTLQSSIESLCVPRSVSASVEIDSFAKHGWPESGPGQRGSGPGVFAFVAIVGSAPADHSMELLAHLLSVPCKYSNATIYMRKRRSGGDRQSPRGHGHHGQQDQQDGGYSGFYGHGDDDDADELLIMDDDDDDGDDLIRGGGGGKRQRQQQGKNNTNNNRSNGYGRSTRHGGGGGGGRGGRPMYTALPDRPRVNPTRDLIESLERAGHTVRLYDDPFAISDIVTADLSKLIDTYFPAAEAPRSISRAKLSLDAYAAARGRFYTYTPGNVVTLDSVFTKSDSPVMPILVKGPPGSGKGSLLANWARVRSIGDGSWILTYNAASSAQGSRVSDVIRFIIMSIKAKFNVPEPIPATEEDLLELFVDWLVIALHRTRGFFVIIVDGIDTLEHDCAPTVKEWLPLRLLAAHNLAPRLRIIASATVRDRRAHNNDDDDDDNDDNDKNNGNNNNNNGSNSSSRTDNNNSNSNNGEVDGGGDEEDTDPYGVHSLWNEFDWPTVHLRPLESHQVEAVIHAALLQPASIVRGGAPSTRRGRSPDDYGDTGVPTTAPSFGSPEGMVEAYYSLTEDGLIMTDPLFWNPGYVVQLVREVVEREPIPEHASDIALELHDAAAGSIREIIKLRIEGASTAVDSSWEPPGLVESVLALVAAYESGISIHSASRILKVAADDIATVASRLDPICVVHDSNIIIGSSEALAVIVGTDAVGAAAVTEARRKIVACLVKPRQKQGGGGNRGGDEDDVYGSGCDDDDVRYGDNQEDDKGDESNAHGEWDDVSPLDAPEACRQLSLLGDHVGLKRVLLNIPALAAMYSNEAVRSDLYGYFDLAFGDPEAARKALLDRCRVPAAINEDENDEDSGDAADDGNSRSDDDDNNNDISGNNKNDDGSDSESGGDNDNDSSGSACDDASDDASNGDGDDQKSRSRASEKGRSVTIEDGEAKSRESESDRDRQQVGDDHHVDDNDDVNGTDLSKKKQKKKPSDFDLDESNPTVHDPRRIAELLGVVADIITNILEGEPGEVIELVTRRETISIVLDNGVGEGSLAPMLERVRCLLEDDEDIEFDDEEAAEEDEEDREDGEYGSDSGDDGGNNNRNSGEDRQSKEINNNNNSGNSNGDKKSVKMTPEERNRERRRVMLEEADSVLADMLEVSDGLLARRVSYTRKIPVSERLVSTAKALTLRAERCLRDAAEEEALEAVNREEAERQGVSYSGDRPLDRTNPTRGGGSGNTAAAAHSSAGQSPLAREVYTDDRDEAADKHRWRRLLPDVPEHSTYRDPIIKPAPPSFRRGGKRGPGASGGRLEEQNDGQSLEPRGGQPGSSRQQAHRGESRALVYLERAIRIMDASSDRSGQPSIDPVLEPALSLKSVCLLTIGTDAAMQRANDTLRRLRDLLVAHYGDKHPRVASVLVEVARIHVKAGRVDQAKVPAKRALAIRAAVFGSNSPQCDEVREIVPALARKPARKAPGGRPKTRHSRTGAAGDASAGQGSGAIGPGAGKKKDKKLTFVHTKRGNDRKVIPYNPSNTAQPRYLSHRDDIERRMKEAGLTETLDDLIAMEAKREERRRRRQKELQRIIAEEKKRKKEQEGDGGEGDGGDEEEKRKRAAAAKMRRQAAIEALEAAQRAQKLAEEAEKEKQEESWKREKAEAKRRDKLAAAARKRRGVASAVPPGTSPRRSKPESRSESRGSTRQNQPGKGAGRGQERAGREGEGEKSGKDEEREKEKEKGKGKEREREREREREKDNERPPSRAHLAPQRSRGRRDSLLPGSQRLRRGSTISLAAPPTFAPSESIAEDDEGEDDKGNTADGDEGNEHQQQQESDAAVDRSDHAGGDDDGLQDIAQRNEDLRAKMAILLDGGKTYVQFAIEIDLFHKREWLEEESSWWLTSPTPIQSRALPASRRKILHAALDCTLEPNDEPDMVDVRDDGNQVEVATEIGSRKWTHVRFRAHCILAHPAAPVTLLDETLTRKRMVDVYREADVDEWGTGARVSIGATKGSNGSNADGTAVSVFFYPGFKMTSNGLPVDIFKDARFQCPFEAVSAFAVLHEDAYGWNRLVVKPEE